MCKRMSPHLGDSNMKKRYMPLTLIVAGVLLAVVSFAYWQFMSAVENPDEAALPETIAGLSLSQASYDHLVTQIALLDEARDRGEINGSEYDRQREQMVQQAKALLAQPPEQDAASPSPSY